MTIDTLIAELRAGLEGTTPGEWLLTDLYVWVDNRTQVCCGKGYLECCGEPEIEGDYGEIAEAKSEANAHHIALASPQNIRALLDHIEGLEATAESLRKVEANLTGQLDTAEAELARLRAPVTEGEVKSMADHLRFDAQKHDVALYRAAADLIQRLAGQVATVLEREAATTARYDAKLDAAEARLREAVEVMRQVSMACDTYGEDLSFGDMKTVHRIQKLVSAFLSTLEDHSNG